MAPSRPLPVRMRPFVGLRWIFCLVTVFRGERNDRLANVLPLGFSQCRFIGDKLQKVLFYPVRCPWLEINTKETFLFRLKGYKNKFCSRNRKPFASECTSRQVFMRMSHMMLTTIKLKHRCQTLSR